MNTKDTGFASLNSEAPPPYTPIAIPLDFDTPAQQNRPISRHVAAPMIPGPPHMMATPKNIQPYMNNHTQAPIQPQISGPQYYPPHQMYPYTLTPVYDITKFKDPNIAQCPLCGFIGMTRVEKKYSCCQVVSGISMIFTVALFIPGVIILVAAYDYQHYCTRCNVRLGTYKTFCC